MNLELTKVNKAILSLCCLGIAACFVVASTESVQPESEKVVQIEVAKPKISQPDPFEDFAKKFADSIEWAMYYENCPGLAITMVHDSVSLMQRGFGFENTNSRSLIDSSTVFRLGSVSKGFAAVLSEILVKEGAFNWDDKVIDYIPQLRLKSDEQTQKLTIKNLLSQSTGLPPHTFTNQIEAGLDIDQIIPMLSDVQLVAESGKICTYQNVAYALIEKVIEAATGKTYAGLLQEKIFQPLGMSSASTDCESMWHSSKKASPHKFDSRAQTFKPMEFNEKYYNIVSAGGVNASISDMNKYLQLLLGKHPEILNENDLTNFFEPIVESGYERKYFHRWQDLTHDYYALGWRVFDYNGERWLYHGGFVNGFRSEIAINQKHRFGMCMLFNSTCSLTNQATKLFFDQFIHYVNCEKPQL